VGCSHKNVSLLTLERTAFGLKKTPVNKRIMERKKNICFSHMQAIERVGTHERKI
jgi:hypothetical protein